VSGIKQRPPTRAVALIVALIIATYAGTQVVLTRSVVTAAWWQAELARRAAQLAHAHVPAKLPAAPPWQTWLPPAVTATWLTAALIALAMLVVAAGRARWLFLVAALPLLPGRLADGSWAPAMPSFAVRVLVWPHGAHGSPLTLWAWWAAALSALAIAVPAMTYLAVAAPRAPRLYAVDLLLRLFPAVLLVGAIAAWNSAAGEPQDWGEQARRAVLATVAALIVTGGLRLRTTVPLIAVLPALAAGWLTWQPAAGPAWPPLTIDSAARTGAVVALTGAAWAFAQPYVARVWRGGVDLWLDARQTQADKALARELAATAAAAGPDADAEVDGSTVPLPREPARAGGRHRA
jgi:hypothetical protein